MADLSPAAQAVLDAYDISSDGHYDDGVWIPHIRKQLAAALRAAADQLGYGDGSGDPIINEYELLAIAAELEGGND